MKIPNASYESHGWRIRDIAPDFKLLDAWALPARGSFDDFDDLIEGAASFDPAAIESVVTRGLFAVRLRVGDLLGWDDVAKKRPIPGCAETTLSVRLPDDLRGSAATSQVGGALQRAAGGFAPLYRTDDEWAAEVSNATVHGVLHLAWIEQELGRYRGHLGVYVKPRGTLGEIYMKLIEPFRQLIVYPTLMRHLGRAWAARDSQVEEDRIASNVSKIGEHRRCES